MKPDLRPIVIDTREKSPWVFSNDTSIERKALVAGDYSVSGMERLFAIERKSLDDLVNTVMRDRERFAAELSILSTMRYAAIVVEASFVDVANGKYTSKWPTHAVIGALTSIQVAWRIPILFATNRGGAALCAYALLRKCEMKFATVPSESQRDAQDRN